MSPLKPEPSWHVLYFKFEAFFHVISFFLPFLSRWRTFFLYCVRAKQIRFKQGYVDVGVSRYPWLQIEITAMYRADQCRNLKHTPVDKNAWRNDILLIIVIFPGNVSVSAFSDLVVCLSISLMCKSIVSMWPASTMQVFWTYPRSYCMTMCIPTQSFFLKTLLIWRYFQHGAFLFLIQNKTRCFHS